LLVLLCAFPWASSAGCNSELAAAKFLGYNNVLWNNYSGKEKQPAVMDKDWSGLADNERAAAVALGYTAINWDNPKPASANKDWSELKDQEKVAAGVLGYTGKSWDSHSGAVSQPASASKSWSELTDKEKAAAGVLGHTVTSWDDDSAPLPASDDKSWSKLTSCASTTTTPITPGGKPVAKAKKGANSTQGYVSLGSIGTLVLMGWLMSM